MTVIVKSAKVPFKSSQMYDLVNAIEEYPKFLDGCADSKVHNRSDLEIKATLYLAKGGLKYGFTTLNKLTPPNKITMQLLEGPFNYLNGSWTFNDVKDGCKIDFELAYEFSNKIFSLALSSSVNKMANSLVNGFVERAIDLYEN